MKNAQEKFNNVVKEGIAPILKKNNFKKKGLNFYKDLGDIGHAIKIQKDKWNSKDEVRFTLNIGIFSKPYWFAKYNYDNEIPHPTFPQEPVSIVRKRIGDIKYGYDYFDNTISGDLNEDGIINILDVVIMVNDILASNFSENADINSDGSINVLDIVQLVNIILN